MSFKHLFNKAETLKSLSNKSAEEIASVVESSKFQEQDIVKENRYIPAVDYSNPRNFATYGSAEKYYKESIERIIKTYPYDGSLKERLQWENDSTDIDLYIYNDAYPRSTGYVILAAEGWGTSNTPNDTEGYGSSSLPEYISLKGGPHPNPNGMSPMYLQFTGSNFYETGSNRGSNLECDLSGSGVTVEFWMKKDEFLLTDTTKEVVFDLWNNITASAAHYGRLRIELSGGSLDGTGADPFRVTLMSGTTGAQTASVCASTFTTASVADGNWHHYAFSFKALPDEEDGITSRFYVDGELNNETTIATGSGSPQAITGALTAYIGALQTPPQNAGTNLATFASSSCLGKLSASLDEFRYWKTQRTSADVGRFWFTQVAGGTNMDPMPFVDTLEMANTKLGVYYKFNEGITSTDSTDLTNAFSTVLDYSGRVTNGTWVGYTSTSRNTGSAIVSSSAATKEFLDPIIYPFQSDVSTLKANLITSGSDHDASNAAMMYNSIPSWITEEDTERGGTLLNLTQIMSSYFDTLQLQIGSLNKLKDIDYVSGSNKVTTFAERLLTSQGLVSPELFVDASVLEKLADRSENKVFEKTINEVKNLIYKNIYNNLNYIYKSKGTEKAFRNLIRCFGLDEDLIKINMYANNVEFDFTTNRKNRVTTKKFANFNLFTNGDANVCQLQSATDTTNTYGFISSSAELTGGYAFTLEAEVIFPEKFSKSDDFYIDTNVISSSLFGVHATTAQPADTPGSEPAQTDTAFPTDDATNFQVYAIRDSLDSSNAQFFLTCSAGGYVPLITSSLFLDVYNNSNWNFAVKISPKNFPWAGQVPGAASDEYTIEFQGVQVDAGVITNSFNVTGSSPVGTSAAFITGSRRVYVGAHKTNVTGTTLSRSDVKISSVRFWLDRLSEKTIENHAYDSENYGRSDAGAYAFPFESSSSLGDASKIDTLILNWDFNQNTGSDASGEFRVADLHSGSNDLLLATSPWPAAQRLGRLLYLEHPGFGSDFLESSTSAIDKEYVVSAKQNLPESIESSDMITVLNQQDEVEFTRDSRPQNYFLAFEKSMYQTISEQMINYFASLADMNTLIGAPVNYYRSEYKGLKFLRQRFFERVSNNEIDFEKFFEFYKWIDGTLSVLLGQLAPISLDFDPNVRNLIESHILERSKYQNKFPFLAKSEPDLSGTIGTIAAPITVNSIINDAQGTGIESAQAPTKRVTGMPNTSLLNSWKYDHAPLPTASWAAGARPKQNGISGSLTWWQNRAERGGLSDLQNLNATGVMPADALADRQILLNAIKASNNRTLGRPYKFSGGGSVVLGGVARHPSDRKNFVYEATRPEFYTTHRGLLPILGGGWSQTGSVPQNIMVAMGGDVEKLISSSDEYFPSQKVRYGFKINPSINQPNTSSVQFYDNFNIVGDGATLAPFSLYSSSINDPLATEMSSFTGSTIITNMHSDLASTQTDVPMQGPFTEKFVGGRQQRHIELNVSSAKNPNYSGLDTCEDRPEGFKIIMGYELTGGVKIAVTTTPWLAAPGRLNIVSPQYPNVSDAGNYNYGAWRFNLPTVPKANLSREEYAKRPVNIKNIKMTTGSLSQSMSGTLDHNRIGNYSKNYEVIQTAGRSQNDPFFQDQSFSFALHPETLATRGRFPLENPKHGGLAFNGVDDGFSGRNNSGRSGSLPVSDASEMNDIMGGTGATAKSFAISCWVFVDGIGSPYDTLPTIVNIGQSDRNLYFNAYSLAATNKLFFQSTTTSNNLHRHSTAVILPSTWHHVVATYGNIDGTAGGQEIHIYVDGELADGAGDITGLPDPIATYGIQGLGISTLVPARVLKGGMCDFAIWDAYLEQDQVTEIYNNGIRFNLQSATCSPNLALWFPMDSMKPWPQPFGANSAWAPDSYDGGAGEARIYAVGTRARASSGSGDTWTNMVGPSSGPVTASMQYRGGQSQVLSGNLDYAIPARTGSDSNQSIIVNRFNAPGGYDVSSKGYMDPAHEEFSVYNALPFRNRGVINFGLSGSASAPPSGSMVIVNDQIDKPRGLNQLWTLRSGRFGRDAAYGDVTLAQASTNPGATDASASLPSFSKIPRNAQRKLTMVATDNEVGEFTENPSGLWAGTFINIGDALTWNALIGGGYGDAQGRSALPSTISMWIRLNDASDTQYLFSFGALNRYLAVVSSKIRYYIYGNTANGAVEGTTSLSDDTWYHVTVTYDGTDPAGNSAAMAAAVKVYVNGSDVSDTPLAATNDPDAFETSWDCVLGCALDTAAPGKPNTGMDGYMGEVGIWQRVLSPAEVSTLYNGGKIINILGDPALQQGITAWYRVNTSAGDTTTRVFNQIGTPGTEGRVNTTAYAGYDGAGYELAYTNADTLGLVRTDPSWPQVAVTGSRYDNMFVQHQIPRSDRNYQWITSSMKSGSAFFEYDKLVDAPGLPYEDAFLPRSVFFEGSTTTRNITAVGTWDEAIGGLGSETKAFSTSFWVRWAADDINGDYFIGAANTSAGGLFIGYTGNYIIFETKNRLGGNCYVRGPVTGLKNTWVHIVGTAPAGVGGTLNLYVNGVLENDAVVGARDKEFPFSGPLVIGGYEYAGSAADRVGKRICDVAVWNKELTAADVTEIYNSGQRKNLLKASMAGNLVSWIPAGADRRDFEPAILNSDTGLYEGPIYDRTDFSTATLYSGESDGGLNYLSPDNTLPLFGVVQRTPPQVPLLSTALVTGPSGSSSSLGRPVAYVTGSYPFGSASYLDPYYEPPWTTLIESASISFAGFAYNDYSSRYVELASHTLEPPIYKPNSKSYLFTGSRNNEGYNGASAWKYPYTNGKFCAVFTAGEPSDWNALGAPTFHPAAVGKVRSPFTVAAWVKTNFSGTYGETSKSVYRQRIWSFDDPAAADGFQSYMNLYTEPENPGSAGDPVASWLLKFRMGGKSDGTGVGEVYVQGLKNHEWAYVVCTYDGTDPENADVEDHMKIYINGKQPATYVGSDLDDPQSFYPHTVPGRLTIGNVGLGGSWARSEPFNGYIDELQVYDAELSAGEIEELFRRRGVNMFGFQRKKNLLSWYRMGVAGDTTGVIKDVIRGVNAINIGATGELTGSLPADSRRVNPTVSITEVVPISGSEYSGSSAPPGGFFHYVTASRWSDSFVTLHKTLLNLNGTYGYPSWKQIRTGQHPVARKLRETNRISIVDPPGMVGQFAAGATIPSNMVRGKSSNTFTDYIEQPISSRYRPFLAAFEDRSDDPDRGNNTSVRVSYGNNITYFSNEGLNSRLNLVINATEEQAYNEVQEFIDETGQTRDSGRPQLAAYASYGERIYPAEANVYQDRVRTRTNYKIDDVWNNLRRERVYPLTNSQGFADIKTYHPNSETSSLPGGSNASPWPLDAPMKFNELTTSVGARKGTARAPVAATTYVENTASAWLQNPSPIAAAYRSWSGVDMLNSHGQIFSLFNNLMNPGTGSGAGELQNTYNYYSAYLGIEQATVNGNVGGPQSGTLHPGASYVRPQPETPRRVPEGAAASNQYNNTTLIGFQPWLAPYQTGLSPYQPYDDYATNIRVAGKDHSIVPEFRISEVLEDYYGSSDVVPSPDGFLQKLPNLLNLTGASIPNSSDSDFYKVYTNTDFLQMFKIVDDDLRGPREGSDRSADIKRYGLTLKASAFISFLPYKGMYPAERTVKLASYFSQSMGSFLPGTRSCGRSTAAPLLPAQLPTSPPNAILSRILLEPLVSPGILFNTIKSGIAVSSFVVRNTASNPGDTWPALGPGISADSSDGRFIRRRYGKLFFSTKKAYFDMSDAITAASFAELVPRDGYYEYNFNSSASVQSASVNSASFAPLNIGLSGNAGAYTWCSSPDTYDSRPVAGKVFAGSRFGYYMHKIPFEAIRRPQDYLSWKALSPSGSSSAPIWGEGIGGSAAETDGLLINTASSNTIEAAGGLGAGWLEDTGATHLSSSIMCSVGGAGVLADNCNNRIRWEGVMSSPLYELGIDNFLCETVNFFQDGLTSYVSKEETEFLPVEKNVYYGMRVNLYRSEDENGNPNFGMYSRAAAFGTPIGLTGSSGTGITFSHLTPPYYNGYATADVIYKAPFNDRPALQDIISTAVVEYDRAIEANLQSGSTAGILGILTGSEGQDYNYVPMQISASVNIFDKILAIPEGTNAQKTRWLVQSKFETPTLNFYDTPCLPHPTASVKGGGGRNPIDVTSSAAPYQIRGMWHQYGELPTQNNQGIFLGVQNLPIEYSSSNYGIINVKSLRDVVGFDNAADQKIGRLKRAKTVREAVVVVPFVIRNNQRKFLRLPRARYLKRADRFVKRRRERGLESSARFWEAMGERYDIQTDLLNRYVFPPTLDFITNETVRPMFFDAFEFEHTFSQKDLQNIWQNLPPESNSKFEKAVSTLNIPEYFTNKLFGGFHSFRGDLHWMVFKVKQRAAKDYSIFSKQGLTKDTPVVAPSIESPYTFNWPYDYFSLVELLKIDESVEYISKDVEVSRWDKPAPTPMLAAPIGTTLEAGQLTAGDYTEAEATAILNQIAESDD